MLAFLSIAVRRLPCTAENKAFEVVRIWLRFLKNRLVLGMRRPKRHMSKGAETVLRRIDSKTFRLEMSQAA